MIPAQFDALARFAGTARSRRALLGPALAALLALRGDQAAGKKRKGCKKPCSPCRRCKRGKCKPRPDGAICGENQTCNGGSCQRAVPPTCGDGLYNGDETDVDCGGSCLARCANGRGCSIAGDCASGHCVSNACQVCTPGQPCGSDGDGACDCDTPDTGGPPVCRKSDPTGGAVTSCTECPASTACFEFGRFGLHCFKPCGAA